MNISVTTKTILLIQLTTALHVAAQKPQKSSDDITSVKTDKHINIPGTRIYLVTPATYSTAETFVGFKKGKSVVINVFDHRGVSYYSNEINFGEDKYPAGAEVLSNKSLHVNKYLAQFMHVQNDQKVRSLGFAFGDSTFTAMLMGIYYSGDTLAEAELKKIFRSVYYDKTLKIDPYEKAEFTLEDSKSPFKLLKDNYGTFIFTLNGKPQKQNGEDPFITARVVPLDSNMNAKGLAEFYLNDLEKYGLADTKIKRSAKTKINELEAYELEVSGTIKEKKYLLYELAITKEKKAIIIEGSMRADSEKYLEEMKKLGKTARFK